MDVEPRSNSALGAQRGQSPMCHLQNWHLPKLAPPPSPPLPPQKPVISQPLSAHAWPRAEEAIVMPAVGNKRSSNPLSSDDSAPRVAIPVPGITTDKNRAPDTSEIQSDRMNGGAEYKPFFTVVGKAVPNRQHGRLVMVVPILLIVIILLFVFAYIASK